MEPYTLPPWVIEYGGQEQDDFAVITSPHSNRAICNLEPLDYLRANALLIAAAPDLLAACERARRYIWSNRSTLSNTGHLALNAVCDAINKAKGEVNHV